jgi:nicotinate phosphoribosyltransferase
MNVYKLVELNADGAHTYTAKYSEDKNTVPGAKQIYRSVDHDLVALQTECSDAFDGQPLVRPVLINGQLVEPFPAVAAIRDRALAKISKLPEELHSIDAIVDYPVHHTDQLLQLSESLRSERQLVRLSE